MNRTQIIALGALGGIIILGVGIYFIFFAERKESLSVTETNIFDQSGTREAVDSSSETLGEGNSEKQGAGEQVSERFFKITDGPVSYGVASLFTPEKKELVGTSTTSVPAEVEIRYIERLSGNIYSYRVHERTLTRINNATVPGIVEALWLQNGSRVFGRMENSLGQIETYSLSATTSDGFFLEAGIESLATNGINELATLLPNTNGSVGTLARADGQDPKTLFTSTLASLSLAYTGNSLLATTKPSFLLPGYAFTVSRDTGAFSRILGPYTALNTLPSPSGKYILYSTIINSSPSLVLFDTKTREEINLPLLTLADKCVWTANENALYCGASRSVPQGLPDSWYQGATSFSDRIWKIDIANRVAVMVLNPEEVGNVSIDAVSLTVDASEDTLTFTDKKTGALYVFDL